jgi:hypothetical protein
MTSLEITIPEDDFEGGFTITVTKTDEGFVMDAYQNNVLVLTEAMTAEEWLEWMADRQAFREEERAEAHFFKLGSARIG